MRQYVRAGKRSTRDGLEPYTLQTFGDITVGIIGLTDPMAFYSFFKLNMGDPAAIPAGLIAEVRASRRTDDCLVVTSRSKKDQIVAENRRTSILSSAHTITSS